MTNVTATAHVLVADDDMGIRTSVSGILRSCGFVVSEARDGQDALDKLRSGEVEAVVLDVRMPRKDGISVVEEMIPEPPPPGILLVTAYDIDRKTREHLGKKVHRVLRKPVPPEELIKAVDEAVEAGRSSRGA